MAPKQPLDTETRKIYIEDIRFAKQQLWRTTYYALILMSAIAYFSVKTVSPPWVRVVLIAMLACISIIMIIIIQDDINGYRKDIETVGETKKNNRNLYIDLLYPTIFIVTITLTAFLLCYFPLALR
jgi:Ca2+/Na+ antiporter